MKQVIHSKTKDRFLIGNKKEAVKFFENRIIREEKTIDTKKGPIRLGYDRLGNKVTYREFSSSGNHPTIEIFEKGKTRVKREIKFK